MLRCPPRTGLFAALLIIVTCPDVFGQRPKKAKPGPKNKSAKPAAAKIPDNVKRYLDAVNRPPTPNEQKQFEEDKAERLRRIDRQIKNLRPDATTEPKAAKQVAELEDERKKLTERQQPDRHIYLRSASMELGDVGELGRYRVLEVMDDREVILEVPEVDRGGGSRYLFLRGISTHALKRRDLLPGGTVAEYWGTKTFESVPSRTVPERMMPMLWVVRVEEYQRRGARQGEKK